MLPRDTVSHVNVALIGGKKMEPILELKTFVWTQIKWTCQTHKSIWGSLASGIRFFSVSQEPGPTLFENKGQVIIWPSEDALKEDVFSPQDPSQPLPDANGPTTRVKYQNAASGMEETQWLSPSSIVWASEWAVSLLGLCKSHSGSHPPASFSVIFLKSFLVYLLAALQSGFLGRNMLAM